MKMFRNLYTKAQEMSAEKVLDTNSITTALSTEMDDLKEAWRKDQKTFFSDIMQAEANSTESNLRQRLVTFLRQPPLPENLPELQINYYN